MEIYVKDLKEVKELNIVDLNGVNWIEELIDGAENLEYNNDNLRVMDLEKFNFWEKYISDYMENEEEIDRLASLLKIKYTELIDELSVELGNDYEEHNNITKDYIKKLRKNLEQKKVQVVLDIDTYTQYKKYLLETRQSIQSNLEDIIQDLIKNNK